MKYRYDNRRDYDLKKACKEFGFIADKSFWRSSNKMLLGIWNGVGASGDWFNPLIPETVYFLNVSLASLPHDWGYFTGQSREHYHITNLYYLYNMNQIVTKESALGLETLRMLRTNKYYIGTESNAGWNAYVTGKPLLEKPKVF